MTNETQPSYQRNLSRKQVMAAFIGTMASMFLGSIFMTINTTAMPRIITDLGGFSQYAWVFTSYIVAETVSLPLTGKLSDMYGRKWLFVGGMALFTLGAFLCGISQSMTELILYRVVQGFGFGAMNALGFIVIGDLFPPEERGKYSGLMAGVFGFSSVIGPTLGGIITDELSWRWSFFVAVPIGIIILLLFLFMFPNYRPAAGKHKVDFPGVIALSLSIVPLILALNWAGVNYAWSSPVIILLFVGAVVMFVVFLYVENHAVEPIIPLDLFKNRVVSVSSIVAFLQGAAFFPVMNFVPLFFQGVLGVSATKSGGFMTPMMLGMAAGSFVSGQLISRAGGHYRLLGTIGFTITAVGFIMFSGVMDTTTSAITAIVILAIAGFGSGNVMPVHTIAVQNSVPYSVLGTATSLISLLRPVGGVFGMAIVQAMLNNKFASTFTSNLSPEVTAIVAPGELEAIIDNPQALVNTDAQTTLQQMFISAGDTALTVYNQLLTTLREALSSSLALIFLVFGGLTVLGLIANFFLKGVPPHRRDNTPPAPDA